MWGLLLLLLRLLLLRPKVAAVWGLLLLLLRLLMFEMTCGDSSGLLSECVSLFGLLCFFFLSLSLSLCNRNITLLWISIYKVFTLAEPWDVLLADFFFLLEIYYFNLIFFSPKTCS